jgi:hypothetical protein
MGGTDLPHGRPRAEFHSGPRHLNLGGFRNRHHGRPQGCRAGRLGFLRPRHPPCHRLRTSCVLSLLAAREEYHDSCFVTPLQRQTTGVVTTRRCLAPASLPSLCPGFGSFSTRSGNTSPCAPTKTVTGSRRPSLLWLFGSEVVGRQEVWLRLGGAGERNSSCTRNCAVWREWAAGAHLLPNTAPLLSCYRTGASGEQPCNRRWPTAESSDNG